MANLADVLLFVKVAQLESISRAARSLGMPISTVSRRVIGSGVEARCVSLLRRTNATGDPDRAGTCEYFNLSAGASDPSWKKAGASSDPLLPRSGWRRVRATDSIWPARPAAGFWSRWRRTEPHRPAKRCRASGPTDFIPDRTAQHDDDPRDRDCPGARATVRSVLFHPKLCDYRAWRSKNQKARRS